MTFQYTIHYQIGPNGTWQTAQWLTTANYFEINGTRTLITPASGPTPAVWQRPMQIKVFMTNSLGCVSPILTLNY